MHIEFPWQTLENPEAHEICEAFMAKYHKDSREVYIPALKRSVNELTWLKVKNLTYIPEEFMERTVFEAPVFKNASFLYLMLWNWGDRVYKATPQQFQQFFVNTDWWKTNNDFYISPSRLDWFVVFTHEAQIFVTDSFMA